MIDMFLLRALLAGIGIAMVAGSLGCFIVWRRMAYFGDSLAHSALLGVALGILLGTGPTIGVMVICCLFALTLLWLQQKQLLATDTLLGILAHSSLSIGMVVLSLLDIRFDLHAYLFGDILTISNNSLICIFSFGFIILALIYRYWPSLVLMALHEDLAQAEGVHTLKIKILLMFLLTLMVAISTHVVGILLITSMLVIPAATARQMTRSPESMAIMATAIGILAVILGISASTTLDVPSGPAIVVMLATLFFFILMAVQFKIFLKDK